MTKPAVFGVAAFMVAALIGFPALAAEAQDRVQIEKLMWQYARALDTENAEAYAAVYTPDGQFGTGATAVKGREALKKMINDFAKRAADNETKTGQKRQPLYHMVTNSYLEFVDKDHARLEAYYITVFADGGPNQPPRVAAAGREVDELVRTNGQWLIKSRDVAPK
jgi:uncharacterized protein (TIGR02246 family)